MNGKTEAADLERLRAVLLRPYGNLTGSEKLEAAAAIGELLALRASTPTEGD